MIYTIVYNDNAGQPVQQKTDSRADCEDEVMTLALGLVERAIHRASGEATLTITLQHDRLAELDQQPYLFEDVD